MFNKKNYLLNCGVCDARKIKEEDYSGYEKMMINAGIVVVSEKGKSILNRLPLILNQDNTIEMAEDVVFEAKSVNGSYEITGTTMVQEHTLLVVNGELTILPGTEEVLLKYEKILVNGSVRCPKSLEGYLAKMSVNGSVSVYPEDGVILDDTFILDKYFPLRAKEATKYYAQNCVVILDKTVELERLVAKKVHFITSQLILPEERIEDCVELFDETVAFTVIPAGMTLHYGDASLNEQLTAEGERLYVYGNLHMAEDCDLEALKPKIGKIVVKRNVILKKGQEDAVRKLPIEYGGLEFRWEGRIIENKAMIRVDKALLESSLNKVLVRNAAVIKIAADVASELILDRLIIENCAQVSCKEEQESAVAAIAQNVAQIGKGAGEAMSGLFGAFKDLASTKIINAEVHIM